MTGNGKVLVTKEGDGLWMDSVVVSDSLQLHQYQQHVVTMTVCSGFVDFLRKDSRFRGFID